jgi:hypothetical protein
MSQYSCTEPDLELVESTSRLINIHANIILPFTRRNPRWRMITVFRDVTPCSSINSYQTLEQIAASIFIVCPKAIRSRFLRKFVDYLLYYKVWRPSSRWFWSPLWKTSTLTRKASPLNIFSTFVFPQYILHVSCISENIWPWGLQEVEAAKFQKNRQLVRLSALCSGCLPGTHFC